ncbi:MAG: hypothetical protein ACXADY_01875 [Candidatus Hodarchaeales archaeon]|jgi:hypothetical protein
MPIILRIDVDNPYGWNSFRRKTLNYIAINFRRFPSRFSTLGYLDHAKELFLTLKEAKVPATWFFRVQTKPNQQFQKELLSTGHEIAFHAERTSNLEEFQEDLNILSQNPSNPILGFSKHGSGEIKLSKYHTPNYNLNSLVNLGQQAGLKYFSGNDELPDLEPGQKNDMLVFPGTFWLNEDYRDISKYSIEWFIKKALSGETVVVLTHPFMWFFSRKERKDLNTVLESINDFQTFASIIS